MPTLDEYLQMLAPNQDQMKQQKIAALLGGLGAGLLGGRNWQQGLAQGGLLAANGVASVEPNARAGAMDQLKMREMAQGFADKDQQRSEEQKFQQTLANFQMPSPLQNMAPTPQNAAALTSAPKAGVYERLLAQADALDKQGLPKKAQEYRLLAEKYAPKYKGTETVMKDGKPVLLQTFENQAPTEMGYQPKPEYKQRDMGGALDFYDPLSGTSVGRADKTQTPDSLASNALTIRGQNITMRGQDMVDSRAGDANTIAAGGKLAENTTQLRKEYNALQPVQNYRAAAPLVASAKSAPDTPAGDLDLIYAVGKALDPNSVVREGELNLVIKSGSPLQRFQGMVNYISNGRGRLPPAQRQELLAMLGNRVGQLKAAHDSAALPYIKQAQALGLPMDQVFQVDAEPSGGLTAAEQQELAALKKRFGR